MPATYDVSDAAYSKILMHAAKFPSRPVCGVLLGNDTDGKVQILDSLPLFHNYPLAPALEASMMIVEQYTKESKTRIVGCYWANELEGDTSIHRTAKKLGEQIGRECKNACIVVLDNRRIGEGVKDALKVYIADRSRGAGAAVTSVTGPAAMRNKKLLSVAQAIVDFDDHLANKKLDFLRQDLASFEKLAASKK